MVWRIAALLLDYPTQQTLDMLDELHAAAGSLPPPARPALVSFIDHAGRTPPIDLGEHELPDHLPVVLEFAATVDPVVGRQLLMEYRPVVELLWLSLHDNGSPYRAVLDAVCSTLLEINVADRLRVAELAAQGPPEEEAGLEPYGGGPDDARAAGRTPVTTLLWLTVPYVAFTSFVVDHIWRYRHDQFGWTTRSSQSYESRLLRLGSALFHFGLLAVLGEHILGIGIPASWAPAATPAPGKPLPHTANPVECNSVLHTDKLRRWWLHSLDDPASSPSWKSA